MKAWIWSFVSLAGLSCGLTLLFLGMRAVMEIGGACADGGPYVSAQPCPEGVPGLMLAGIWGGLIFAGMTVWAVDKLHPDYTGIALWAWPALFLSLGWNFFEFGIDPPGQEGVEVGWLVCGVLFALMGGVPLIGLVGAIPKTFWPQSAPPPEAPPRRPAPRDFVPLSTGLRRVQARRTPPKPPTVDVAGQLERLAGLHDRGALDDAEYDAAKRAILGE